MIALSAIWLGITIFELGGGESEPLKIAGDCIWVIFVVEFSIRLIIAPSKPTFLRHNWLAIAALALPALRLFRSIAILRAARVLRGARLVRVVGTIHRSMTSLRRSLSRRGFGYVVLSTLVVLLCGAAGMLSFEPAPEVDGGFTSYADALWWTGMLMASLGTDFWPRTIEGRLLTSLLALYGLAVFGYITATLATFFIDRDSGTRSGEMKPADLRLLRKEIAALRNELQVSSRRS